MSIILKYEDQLHLFTKGASEMVLHGCTDIYNSSKNAIETINQGHVDKVIRSMAEKSLRTLCLAYKRINTHDNFEKKDEKGVF